MKKCIYGMLFLLLLSFTLSTVSADYSFSVPESKAVYMVDSDGRVTISYEYQIENHGQPLDYIDIGMPNKTFRIEDVYVTIDDEEVDLSRIYFADSEETGLTHGVTVDISDIPIRSGESIRFFIAVPLIEQQLYRLKMEDETEPQRVSFNFQPNYFDSSFVRGNTKMGVRLYLPAGMTDGDAQYKKPENWSGSSEPTAWFDEEGMLVYEWTAEEASASKKYKFGGTFPISVLTTDEFVLSSDPSELSTGETISLLLLCCVGPFILIIFGIWKIIKTSKAHKKNPNAYFPPSIRSDGKGIKRGLTAVEAAVLLELDLERVMNMILYGLMKKGVVQVLKQDPLKIEIVDPLPEDLKEYEKDFLSALKKEDDNYRTKLMKKAMQSLILSVHEKMEGFSVKETQEYYRSICEKAWSQVTEANTPDVQGALFEKHFGWEMLTEDPEKKMDTVFKDREFYAPSWWWRMDPMFRPSHGHSVYVPKTPSSEKSSGSGSSGTRRTPVLPGAEFARSLTNSTRNMANSMVGSMALFRTSVAQKTNPVLASNKSSSSNSRSGRGGSSGGCACACACDCAGCACACAGGGR